MFQSREFTQNFLIQRKILTPSGFYLSREKLDTTLEIHLIEGGKA